jgi:hypothetical protein
MGNRINVAELLKDCPTGMELDSTMFEKPVKYTRLTKDEPYIITIETPCGRDFYLTKEGYLYDMADSKCIIFPKGKTTWEGFHRPFKDGDIIYNRLQKKICIYYLRRDEVPCIKGCRYNEYNTQLQFETLEYPIPIVIQDYRFATEEEKAKLFNAIKENGYKWNADTKTLEKTAKLIFNNGDVVATTSGAWIGITTGGVSGELIPTHCVIKSNGAFEAYTDVKNTWCFSRFATKEERQKLFDEIEAHGYTWNSKTKTLEILIEPNFKVGDWVTDGVSKCQIYFIDDTQYWYSENCVLGSIESVDKQYHLWTINDAKDGDVLFHSDSASNGIFIFKEILQCGTLQKVICYCDYDSEDGFCLGENHTCCWADSKILYPATKERCNRLFQKMKEAGYRWNAETKTLEKLIQPQFKVGNIIQDKDGYKVRVTEVNIEDECYEYESMIAKGIGCIAFRNQDDWELVPNKFNINTLIPFESKVLVRHNKDNKWTGSFFSFVDRDLHSHCYKFVTTADKSYPMMIPYKGNEYLLGKTDDCQDFYKIWE